MAKVVIDGVEYEVNPDNNLLQEALSKGLDLPYFCWHPCMGSVGRAGNALLNNIVTLRTLKVP